MREQLQGLNLDYEVFDAIDGKTFSPADYPIPLNDEFWRKKRGWNLTPGEIGCFLSHYTLWQKIAANQIPAALILEDDAVLPFSLDLIVRDVLKCKTKWDIVILHPKKPFAHSVAEDLPDNRRLVRFHRRVGQTVAYIITAKTAQKLLQICGEMRAPIDWMYAEWWRNGLDYFGVLPAPVRESKAASTIERAPKNPRTIGDRIAGALWRFADYRLRRKMIRQKIRDGEKGIV